MLTMYVYIWLYIIHLIMYIYIYLFIFLIYVDLCNDDMQICNVIFKKDIQYVHVPAPIIDRGLSLSLCIYTGWWFGT